MPLDTPFEFPTPIFSCQRKSWCPRIWLGIKFQIRITRQTTRATLGFVLSGVNPDFVHPQMPHTSPLGLFHPFYPAPLKNLHGTHLGTRKCLGGLLVWLAGGRIRFLSSEMWPTVFWQLSNRFVVDPIQFSDFCLQFFQFWRSQKRQHMIRTDIQRCDFSVEVDSWSSEGFPLSRSIQSRIGKALIFFSNVLKLTEAFLQTRIQF